MASTRAPRKPKQTATPVSTEAGRRLDDQDVDAYQVFMRCWRASEKAYNDRAVQFARNWQTYLGQVDARQTRQLKPWRSKLHPPYLGSSAEVLIAQLQDEHPQQEVLPVTPGDAQASRNMDLLLREQRRLDGFDPKTYRFLKQAVIMGFSVFKSHWKVRRAWRYEQQQTPSNDPETGEPVLDETGEPSYDYEQVLCSYTRFNQPSATVCDAFDCWWDPKAVDLEECGWFCHETWETYEALQERAEARDENDKPIYRNLDLIDEQGPGELRQTTPAAGQLPDQSYIVHDRRGCHRVSELWLIDGQGLRTITMVNREHVIREERCQYWHGELPFAVCTTIPSLYSLNGISEMDLAAELQLARWSTLNQRRDNVELINNIVVFVRETVDNRRKIRIFPGAVIPVADPAEINFMSPRTSIIEQSLEEERALAQDMDNLLGTSALLSGALTGEQVDPKTAQEVKGLQSAGQRRITAKKNLFYAALERLGMLQIELNQQLLDETWYVRIAGGNGLPWRMVEVDPGTMRDARFRFRLRTADEALLDQEAKERGMQLFNTAVPALGPLIQLAQQLQMPDAIPNPKSIWELLLQPFGPQVSEGFFAPAPIAAPPPLPQFGPSGVAAPDAPPPAPPPAFAANGAGGQAPLQAA